MLCIVLTSSLHNHLHLMTPCTNESLHNHLHLMTPCTNDSLYLLKLLSLAPCTGDFQGHGVGARHSEIRQSHMQHGAGADDTASPAF